MTVFAIAKAHLLRLSNTELEKVSDNNPLQTLKPVDCAQFLTAFARLEIFDFEVFEALERNFFHNIDKAEGETLVTMFLAHSALSQDVIR